MTNPPQPATHNSPENGPQRPPDGLNPSAAGTESPERQNGSESGSAPLTATDLAHALDNSTPYPVELDMRIYRYMAARLLEMLHVGKRPEHPVWQPEEPLPPSPEPLDPEQAPFTPSGPWLHLMDRIADAVSDPGGRPPRSDAEKTRAVWAIVEPELEALQTAARGETEVPGGASADATRCPVSTSGACLHVEDDDPECRGACPFAAAPDDGLRQRAADAIYGTYGQQDRDRSLRIADAVLAVRDDELARLREEADALRQLILDIDAHATPYGDVPDEPGWVGTYLVTAGALHRALGKIGHTAPACQAEAALARVREVHLPIERGGNTICAHCSGWNGFRCVGVVQPHPCQTLAALDGAGQLDIPAPAAGSEDPR